MSKSTIKKSRVLLCSWCRTLLQADQKIWYFPMKSKIGVFPKGQCLEMKLFLGKMPLVYIIGENSPLRKESWQMMFLACSPDCIDKLRATMERNKEAELQSSLN